MWESEPTRKSGNTLHMPCHFQMYGITKFSYNNRNPLESDSVLGNKTDFVFIWCIIRWKTNNLTQPNQPLETFAVVYAFGYFRFSMRLPQHRHDKITSNHHVALICVFSTLYKLSLSFVCSLSLCICPVSIYFPSVQWILKDFLCLLHLLLIHSVLYDVAHLLVACARSFSREWKKKKL